jgi:hypothetical protein
MSNHLSQDQFANCVVGRSTSAELQHVKECSECGAELERFRIAVSSFRNAVRGRVDARLALQGPEVSRFSMRPAAAGLPRWRWALAAVAVVVVVMIPLLTSEKEPQEVIEKASTPHASPDALMEAVNRHLSRTLPAPMEPMMVLIGGEEQTTKSGGIQ